MKCFVATLGVFSYLVILADAGASMHNPFFCYATDTIRSMTNMGAIVTSYEAIRRFNFTTVNPYVSTCAPSRIWYLGRYGSRVGHPAGLQRMIDFAESSVQEDIINNYEAGRTSLCRQDYELIRNFSMDSDIGDMFRIENADLVTEAGVIAMENIARRYQQVFPNILTETYTPARFHFRHTGSARSNTSIRAFAAGLFGQIGSENVVYEPVPAVDWFLRPLDFCPAWIEETADSERQRIAFREGPEVYELVQEVNNKLGFHASKRMDFNQIFAMYNWCRFMVTTTFEISNSETGVNSPWCAPFSVNHHLVFEYYEELDFFYLTGYGVRNERLLQNLNCGRIQDLVRHMQSEDDSDTMARIFITEAEEIMTMLVTLGVFRDVWPIHQHNFAQQTGRNWLVALLTPFSSNLVVVRFDCDDGDHDLIFLLNERPILIPGCDQQNGVCKVSVIADRFQRFIDANCSTLFCGSD